MTSVWRARTTTLRFASRLVLTSGFPRQLVLTSLANLLLSIGGARRSAANLPG